MSRHFLVSAASDFSKAIIRLILLLLSGSFLLVADWTSKHRVISTFVHSMSSFRGGPIFRQMDFPRLSTTSASLMSCANRSQYSQRLTDAFRGSSLSI